MSSTASGGVYLMFVVAEDWYFVSHRLALARAAAAAGFSVSVVTRRAEHGDLIEAAGIRIIDVDFARGRMNPLRDIAAIAKLVRIYRTERPSIVHHVAMKPVLYGSTAAALVPGVAVVNALAGLGWIFTSESRRARLLSGLVSRWLGSVLTRGSAIVQNPDDRDMLLQAGVPQRCIHVIGGSGVDLEEFRPTPEPEGSPVIVLPARLLWDKGVGEFVEAARLLRQRGTHARFVLVGSPDPLNPSAIPAERVAEWVDSGLVENTGWVADVAAVLAGCHIVCLPSYREGLPKALIEAAAAGRAIVATDVPGCREVVIDGWNGRLVPPRDAAALAAALEQLVHDPELRQRMGRHSREHAERNFGLDDVIRKTLALYRTHATGSAAPAPV